MEVQQTQVDQTTPQSEDATQKRPNDTANPPSLMDVVPFDDREPTMKKGKEDFIRCNDCKIILPPGQDAEAHFSGKKHAKRVAMNKTGEQRDSVGRWQDDRPINVHPQDHSTPSVASQFRNNQEVPNNTYENNSPYPVNNTRDPPYPVNNTRDPPPQNTYHNEPNTRDPLPHNTYHNEPRDGRHDTRRDNFHENSAYPNYEAAQKDTTDYRGSGNNYRQNYPRDNQPYSGAPYSDDRHVQGYTTTDNRSSHKTGYPSSSVDSGKDNALKSFYGKSLNSYFNPPEKDYMDDLPDNLAASPPKDNFSRQNQNNDDQQRIYDSNQNYNRSAYDHEAPQSRESNRLTESSRYGELSRRNESSRHGEPSGFFESSHRVSEKPKESLALKSFYGSSLDSYFNPPENDYLNKFPDQPTENVDEEERSNAYYENLANAEASKVDFYTNSQESQEVKEKEGPSEEDFWNDPPDNLLSGHCQDSDEEDNAAADNVAPEEPVKHEENDNLPYSGDTEDADPVECTFDSSRLNDDHTNTPDAGKHGSTDDSGSGNYYSNRYYEHQNNNNRDNYANNDYSTSNYDNQEHPNYREEYTGNNPTRYDDGFRNNGNNYSDAKDGFYNRNDTNNSISRENYEAKADNDESKAAIHNSPCNDITQMKEQVVGT